MSRENCTVLSRSLTTSGLLLLFAVAPSARVDAATLTIHLVPGITREDATHLSPERLLKEELKEGEVRLYRVGSLEPELRGQPGRPIQVPPGDWFWVGEAPGYISVTTDVYTVDFDTLDRVNEWIAPVLPACRVRLGGDRRWQTADRVDFVSVSTDAVFPRDPRVTPEGQIPAGRYLDYVVRNGVITGISGVRTCAVDHESVVEYPEPPPPGHQAMMVTASVSDPLAGLDRNQLGLALEQGGASLAVQPAAAIDQQSRMAWFFPDLPSRATEVALEHPRARTLHGHAVMRSGTVQIVELGTLKPRREIRVAIDYRPARSHRLAELELRPCPADQDPALLVVNPFLCGKASRTVPIEPGLHDYSFDRVDDGRYLLSAAVDDERITGLGIGAAPLLDPASDTDLEAIGPARLVEERVYGNLRRDDAAVAGTVSLVPWAATPDDSGTTAATDDELTYSLYYFSRLPDPGMIALFPEELRSRSAEELPGLYCCYRLTACDDEGCRAFNQHSLFTGGGRFDIELGSEKAVTIAVRDAASGDPIPGARVYFRPTPAFHFIRGDVVWFESPGIEPDSLDSDARGEARWLPPGPGTHSLVVGKDGYLDRKMTVDLAESPAHVEVALQREPGSDPTLGTTLRLAGGGPLRNAYLLAFGSDGAPTPGCDVRADAQGVARPNAECQVAEFLLVHPEAEWQPISPSQLLPGATVEVEPPARSPAPRVRLVTPAGAAVPNAMVAITVEDLHVDPNDISRAGGIPIPVTGADGVTILRGIRLERTPDVTVEPFAGYGWEGDAVPLVPGEESEPVRVVARPTAEP